MNVLKRWLGVEQAWDDEVSNIVIRQNETRAAVMDASRSAQSLQEAVEEEERRIAQRRMQVQIDLRRPRRRVTD